MHIIWIIIVIFIFLAKYVFKTGIVKLLQLRLQLLFSVRWTENQAFSKTFGWLVDFEMMRLHTSFWMLLLCGNTENPWQCRAKHYTGSPCLLKTPCWRPCQIDVRTIFLFPSFFPLVSTFIRFTWRELKPLLNVMCWFYGDKWWPKTNPGMLLCC